MEIKIETDAYDEGKCLLMQRDCVSGYFNWKQFKEGKNSCPCKSCSLFVAFTDSKITLSEFRKQIRAIGGYALINDFCDDMCIKCINQD